MKKTVIIIIVGFFALMMIAGYGGKTYTKEAAEKHFISAIVFASVIGDDKAVKITSDTAYIVSEKILKEQTYRNAALQNEKYFDKRFGNVRKYEQELNRGLICVAKFYFDDKELKEMFKRVRVSVPKENRSSYGYYKRKLELWSYKFERKIAKIKGTFK
jgi:hypothetical protein